MGTQTDIVDEIIKGKGDYCLAVKGNQTALFEDISLYFSDAKLLEKLVKKGQHYQTVEKAKKPVARLKPEIIGFRTMSTGYQKGILNGRNYVALE